MAEYINREAVYKFAKDHREKETGAFTKGYNKGLRVMMAAAMDVGAIPSADVRPVRHGKWIELDDCMTICPECNTIGCGTKYCANCGARLEI